MQYFNLKGKVSYIGGVYWIPRETHLQTLSHEIVLSTFHHERESNSQL
jgi:hypothetical protein